MDGEAMRTHERILVLVAALGALTTLAGCGSSGNVSPQLSGARAVLNEARRSSAARVEPDELLIAERTLDVAENADDGSIAEMHYAYIAEREARVAMADARRRLTEQGIAQDESEYTAELERVARERGQELDTTQRDLRERERILQEERRLRDEQAQVLRQREAQLAAEQEARRVAEENARVAMDRVAQLANVRQGPAETVITLSGEVLFASGSADLRPEARDRLSAVAAALRASTDQSAIVAGYTDSRGARDRNQDLSQRRAEAVREFLVQEGVPQDRIRAEGRGQSMPIAGNSTAEGRATNRRVEIIMTPASTTPRQGATEGRDMTSPAHEHPPDMPAPHTAPPSPSTPPTPPPPVQP
jgi:outer membrane protein OmpA-like peptidoglycan-associated protein